LEDGNITNSVNFPAATLPRRQGSQRLIVANRNQPNMIGNITAVLAEQNINIDDMLNKSREDLAYSIIDLNGDVRSDLVQTIEQLDGVIFARIV